MEKIEFLKANTKVHKARFITVLKDFTVLTVNQLSECYDELLNSKSVEIEVNTANLKKLNSIVSDIMELDIYIGFCSFHEDKG